MATPRRASTPALGCDAAAADRRVQSIHVQPRRGRRRRARLTRHTCGSRRGRTMTRKRGGARRAVGWAGGALRSRDRPPHTTACPRRTRLSGRRAGGLAGDQSVAGGGGTVARELGGAGDGKVVDGARGGRGRHPAELGMAAAAGVAAPASPLNVVGQADGADSAGAERSRGDSRLWCLGLPRRDNPLPPFPSSSTESEGGEWRFRR